MIDDIEIAAIEFGAQRAFRDRHADRVTDTLPQWSGGGFDTRRVTLLGMTRSLRVQLPKILQILDRDVVSGQMQDRIGKHRAMPVGHHEPIAIAPVRVSRIMAHEVVVKDFSDIGHAHWRARMTGIGLLYGIHAQRPDRIGKRFTR